MATMKIIKLILVIFMFALIVGAQEYPASAEQDEGYLVTTERPHTVNNQLLFYVNLGQKLYSFISAIVYSNVKIILWIKKVLFTFLLKLLSYMSYFVANNREFVMAQIDILSSLMKTIVLNMPYFNFPSTIINTDQTLHGYPLPDATAQIPTIFTSLSKILGLG